MKKKLFCILLIVFLVIPFASACSEDDPNDNLSTLATSGSQDGFPLKQRNFGGKTIKILTVDETRGNSYYDCEFAATTTNANKVNDAVYNRTQIIKEDYGINLEVKYNNNPSAECKNMIISGDNTYQLVSDSVLNTAKLGIEGNLWDLSQVPNLNLENEWWDQSVVNDLSTAGYHFYLAGDLMVSDKGATWCCFFNKNLIDEYKLEDPYKLVTDNKWTIDKLYEMAKEVSVLNQSLANVTYKNGTFGFITQTFDGIASMVSFNQKMIAKDENDYPLLNIQNEDTYNKFGEFFEVMMDEKTTLLGEFAVPGDQEKGRQEASNTFYDGRGLFQYHKLEHVQDILEANVNFDYGLLPMPKYNEQQDKYYSTCTVYFSQVVSIPLSVHKEELDAIGYTLELLGYYGKEYVKPAYYDLTIKSQKMSDQESEDMLDIIFANRIFDLASIYDYGNALYLYTDIIGLKTNTIVSKIETNASAIQKKVDESIELFKAINKD